MRSFLRLPTGARFTWAATALYFVLRGASSFSRPAASFPDTLGYETLVFHGTNSRFWPVPLAFRLAPSAGSRVLLHVVVGTLAWGLLASIVSRGTRHPRLAASAVLILGLAPQVVRWDLAMLSESLGISFAVIAVACTVWMANGPSVASRLCWFAALILCAMTRPVHLIVLFACAAGAIVVVVATRARRMVVACVVLVAASVWGVTLLSGNRATSELNLYTVLAERVVTDDAAWNWFVEHGMPDIPAVRTAEGYDFAGDLPPDLAAFVALPAGQQPPAIIRAGGLQLATWVRSRGWRTYAHWVLAHPSDTWTRISSLAPSTLDPPNDDFLPLDPRSILPRGVFSPWWLWAVAGIGALVAGVARPGGSRVTRALAAMTLTSAVVFAVTVLWSGIEHQRHAATVAVLLRVLALVALASLTATVEPAVNATRGRSAARPD